ncbi:MAG: type II toxin-antitoxin system VapC family toxin [Candidatus Marinimicrobia bacterium]|nr:type II toxin-antitoxin system VapC family toxin [Candidatus Neomarinimicrobiota bacterium]
MIVVDVNIIVNLFIDGEHSPAATDLFEQDDQWYCPDIWLHEITNVMSTYVKHGGLSIKKADQILNNAIAYFLDSTFSMPMTDVLKCSIKYNISAYDAEYIVLAKINNTQLVTVDKRLNKAIPQLTRLL